MKNRCRLARSGVILGCCVSLVVLLLPDRVSAEEINYSALVQAIVAIESGGNPRDTRSTP